MIAIGRRAMSFFEELRKGSPFHTVEDRSDRAFTLKPIGDVSFDNFQRAAMDAISNAGSVRRMYDFAAVWLP
jgi:hypothetical protein